MSFEPVSSCPQMADFTSLMEIGFGINLALPVLRELVIISRSSVERKLSAISRLAEIRDFAPPQLDVKAEISKVRRKLIGFDAQTEREVNNWAVFTFMFSLNSLYWLFYSPFDDTCVNAFSLTLSVAVNFLPLPAAIFALNYRCKKRLSEINGSIEELHKVVSS